MAKIETFLNRIYKKLDISNDADFWNRYDIKPNTLSNWKAHNTVHCDKILEIAKKEKISIDYIFLGKDNNTTHNVNKYGYYIKVLSHVASADSTADIEGIEAYDTNEKIFVSSDFLKSLWMKMK